MSKTFGPNRTHGTIATYNIGCRCDMCKEEKRLSQWRRRQRRYGRPDIPAPEHDQVIDMLLEVLHG